LVCVSDFIKKIAVSIWKLNEAMFRFGWIDFFHCAGKMRDFLMRRDLNKPVILKNYGRMKNWNICHIIEATPDLPPSAYQ
jgi:hypothetical protein